MSLRRYFKPKGSLPDANGPLSTSVPPRAIASANREVTRVLKEMQTSLNKKRGVYTASVNALLEENDIYACLLPPNTTDRLQSLDVSVNKPAKDFLRRKFEEWYTEQVIKQLDGKDPDTFDIVPMDLRSAVVKEKSAQWLVDLAHYLEENPHIIVNGFIKTGIAAALDGTIDMGEDWKLKPLMMMMMNFALNQIQNTASVMKMVLSVPTMTLNSVLTPKQTLISRMFKLASLYLNQ